MRTRCYEPTPAWEHALREPDCNCHLLRVVAAGENVVGWLRIFPDGIEGNGNVALGLLPDYRDQGIGTSLLLDGIMWAVARGYEYLNLETRRDNTRAIHVFMRGGFTLAGQVAEGVIRMTRRLGTSQPQYFLFP